MDEAGRDGGGKKDGKQKGGRYFSRSVQWSNQRKTQRFASPVLSQYPILIHAY